MQRVVTDELGHGHRVAYVPHRLPPDMFLDDAHLTSSGNRQMAVDFVEAMAPYLEGRGIAAPAPTGTRSPADAGASARAR